MTRSFRRTPRKVTRPSASSCPTRRFLPTLEALEDRTLPALFLQGTALFNCNAPGGGTPLPGATVGLYSADGSTLLGTQTTDANGNYSFNSVPGGTYRLVETPPVGYTNMDVQILSDVFPAQRVSASTIQVTVPDASPTNPVTFHYDGVVSGSEVVTWSIDGNTYTTYAGQRLVSLSDGGLPAPTPEFYAFCVDIASTPLHGLPPGSTSPTLPEPANTSLPNGGRLAYLISHFDTSFGSPLDPIHGAALQLAIWQVEYGSRFAFLDAGADTAAVLAALNAYLAASNGQSENAVFLDETVGGTYGGPFQQGMLARGSFDFCNTPQAPVQLSGVVFSDLNHDCVQQGGEAGVAGVTVELLGTNDLGQSVFRFTTTNASGQYSFTGLRPSNAAGYTVLEIQPTGYFHEGQTAGSTGGTTADHSITTALTAGANSTGNNFCEELPARVSGVVFADANGDCIQQAGEPGIGGVTVTLTGTDDAGNLVLLTTTTNAAGQYSFTDLRPGNAAGYKLTETPPAGYVHEGEAVGTVNGVADGTDLGNAMLGNIVLGAGTSGVNYNFCERQSSGAPLAHGETATIGFWHNRNGQALINSLNGGPTATALATWLKTTFPNIYGGLNVHTNADVAALFLTDFNVHGQKLDAQVLAAALAVYVTDSSLAGGTMAAGYGFTVNAAGTGAATYNVGSNGAAFGVPNYATLSILQILQAANAQAVNGVLYNGNTSLRDLANTVFDGINQGGDIS